MIMTITIRQALRPLFLTCFIIGSGIFPIKRSKLRIRWVIYLSILYSLTIWSLYVYIIYHAITLFTLHGIFFTTINSIVIIINIFTTITSSFVGIYNQKKLETFINKLDAVDNTLEQLGIPKIYKGICMRSKQMIIGWFLFIIFINIYYMNIYKTLNQSIMWALILSSMINHSIHVNILVDLLFVTFLWYIGNRFDKVHEHIKRLLVKRELWVRCTWNRSIIAIHESTNNHKQVVWITMHLHLELHRIARELNLMFGMQMTFEAASYLIYLTAFWYHISLMIIKEYTHYLSLYQWIVTGLWPLSLIIRMYVINGICDSVRYKANGIDKTIHQLTSILRYADVWKEIYQFTLQIMHHPLRFTGMGLFQFGQKFFWKFYITIATFVMIMIQMKVPINLDKN